MKAESQQAKWSSCDKNYVAQSGITENEDILRKLKMSLILDYIPQYQNSWHQHMTIQNHKSAFKLWIKWEQDHCVDPWRDGWKICVDCNFLQRTVTWQADDKG